MTSDAKQAYYVPNPLTIGRPVHLIDRFTTQVRADFNDAFCLPLNRRYHATFEIGDISLTQPTRTHVTQRPWVMVYRTQMGCISFTPDRGILLCILGYRFGTHANEPATVSEPSSASEERLAATLGSQLVTLIADRIEPTAPGAAEAQSVPGPKPQIAAVPTAVASDEDWILSVSVIERECQLRGALTFALDTACIERLLNSLSLSQAYLPPRDSAAMTRPLPARLQFTLTARLLEKEIPLGVLVDMNIGDVIPISLGDSDVLIAGSRLFTASIAEHHGKLCLTSFEDVE